MVENDEYYRIITFLLDRVTVCFVCWTLLCGALLLYSVIVVAESNVRGP